MNAAKGDQTGYLSNVQQGCMASIAEVNDQQQCNTNTNEMLCGKATRNRGKEQKNSRDSQTVAQARIICLFHYLDINN